MKSTTSLSWWCLMWKVMIEVSLDLADALRVKWLQAPSHFFSHIT